MLILNRKASETGELGSRIFIGPRMVLTVQKVNPGAVKLEIDMPGHARSKSMIPVGSSVRLPADELVIKLIAVRGNQAVLGFEAPRWLEIVRDDVKRPKQEAA